MRLITIYILIISFLYSNNEDWDEVLNYSAYFSGIHVANATLKSKQKINLVNQEILHIEFQAKSRSSMKYIFPINDIISIDVKTKNWEPIRVKKKLREGNYRHNSIAKFNLNKRKFIFKKDTIAFLEKVMNPYSLIYFFRTKTLTPDTSFQINIVDNKKIIPLCFQVEHREKINFEHKNLSILGFQKQNAVSKWFVKSHICVVCSRWNEPFGRTALEASSAGCAVIITNKGGLPEASPKALRINNLNVKNLENALIKLIKNTKFKKTLQKKILSNFYLTNKFVSKKFDKYRNTLIKS